MIISLIAAIGKSNQLGMRGSIPWHLGDDLKNFKKLTSGHAALMGRKTFESIKRPLPNRTNIIITGNRNFSVEGCKIFSSIGDGIDFARNSGEEELFVIGGGEIYDRCLRSNLADKMYLTRVDFDGEADVFFPHFDSGDWEILEEKKFQKNQDNDFDFCFSIMTRKRT
ncbi:MAG: dihydrofolate reductase [Rickettsiales bacterium]|jgi:dihydrofolate reductase|nr:dihydrofolate reductase [Rickettsiales bacterium]